MPFEFPILKQNMIFVILDAQMLASALKALWSLCVNELNAGIATAEKAFKEIIKILEKYPKDDKIVEESMSAIWALCLEDDNEDLVIDAGIGLVIDALNAHPKNPKSKILFDFRFPKNGRHVWFDTLCFRSVFA